MSRYVSIKKMVELTGYTEAAIRTKMNRGVWLEKIHYWTAPDGRKLIDLDIFEQWVRGQLTYEEINRRLSQ